MFLICGLGNKGSAYRNTRHNVGYFVLDRFAERYGITFSARAAGCVVGEGKDALVAKPDTFMNLSGAPVSALMKRRHLLPHSLIVVHDDLDMELGKLKIRWDGGDGGHKGVRSVAEHLHTQDFHRIKIGIGRDPTVPPEEYVLSRFTPDEAETLNGTLDMAVSALHVILTDGKDKAMNMFNR